MIEMRDAMRAVLEHRDGDVVLATETSVAAWQDVSEDDSLHLPLPVMGKGSSMALGVALARPDRRVIVWDGDGCVLMNLGTLVTIAGTAPANLYHIVLDNGMYAMTGGQPLPNQGNFSFTDMAEAAGYAAMYEFDDLEDWTLRIGDAPPREGARADRHEDGARDLGHGKRPGEAQPGNAGGRSRYARGAGGRRVASHPHGIGV